MESIKQKEHQSYGSNHMESICKSDALSALAWWKTDQETTTMLRLGDRAVVRHGCSRLHTGGCRGFSSVCNCTSWISHDLSYQVITASLILQTRKILSPFPRLRFRLVESQLDQPTAFMDLEHFLSINRSVSHSFPRITWIQQWGHPRS